MQNPGRSRLPPSVDSLRKSVKLALKFLLKTGFSRRLAPFLSDSSCWQTWLGRGRSAKEGPSPLLAMRCASCPKLPSRRLSLTRAHAHSLALGGVLFQAEYWQRGSSSRACPLQAPHGDEGRARSSPCCQGCGEEGVGEPIRDKFTLLYLLFIRLTSASSTLPGRFASG